MAFASARGGNKSIENDKGIKEPDTQGRFGNFRSRNGDADVERFREARSTNTTNTFRRRDGEQETEGWSTVKPRKSFGHEGAERFHGRMGGNFRDDRRQPRDRDDAVTRDRPARPFDTFSRDKDADDIDGRTRNGVNRNKSESWHAKSESNEGASLMPEKRERIDRAKSWRERDPNIETFDDRNNDRNNNARTNDRRWGRGDRDHRAEREPEWLDEPLEEQAEAHTQQDFQKWMEEMKKAKNGTPSAAPKSAAAEAAEAMIQAEKPPVQSAPAVEAGPDKFFMNFASTTGLDPATPGAEPKESNKAKGGKTSRFTSFFSNPQEESRNRTEPATPMGGVPLNGMPGSAQAMAGPGGVAAPPEEERQAFQQLLMKLQKQSVTGTPPGPSPFALPPQGTPSDAGKKSALTSPEPYQQYGGERRDGPIGRPPPQHVQEILAPRPQPQAARPDQLLQDLVGHHQRVSSQGSMRPDAARNNSNTEFLMNLMRAGPTGGGPDQQRNELLMRMQQQQQQQPHHHLQKQGPIIPQEPDFARDNRGPPQRQMRPQPPPGFPLEEPPFHPADADVRPNQPTQILQRPPPPPGLDQMPPNWMPGGQLPPPQQRGPMIPPPGLAGGLPAGLAGGPNRNVPLPPMFAPNFPPGAIPPPEALGGLPPRNLPPPPPGFFTGPPHGFIPPGLGGFNGPPGPDFPGSPFEGRGHPGAPGRGAQFGRP